MLLTWVDEFFGDLEALIGPGLELTGVNRRFFHGVQVLKVGGLLCVPVEVFGA